MKTINFADSHIEVVRDALKDRIRRINAALFTCSDKKEHMYLHDQRDLANQALDLVTTELGGNAGRADPVEARELNGDRDGRTLDGCRPFDVTFSVPGKDVIATEIGTVDAAFVSTSWTEVGKRLPDSDLTVHVYDPTTNEPVWLGYHDGERWRYIDGIPATPTHWAEMLEGPNP